MKPLIALISICLLTLVENAAQAAPQWLPESYRGQVHPIDRPLRLEYNLGTGSGRRVFLNVVNYPKGNSDLFFFHMHMNEQDAKRAGEEAVRLRGGTFMYLTHSANARRMKVTIGGQNYTLDPNRVFTEQGIRSDVSPSPPLAVQREVQNFAEWLKGNIRLALANRTRVMVSALHNNTDDDAHGELLSIVTERRLIGIDNLSAHSSPAWDIDNFYIAIWQSTYDTLVRRHNVNISLRLPRPRPIGYLSNWMIDEGIEYINVEAQHGDTGAITRMIEIIQQEFR